MPNRHNAIPPSNARVRRQAHLERDREIKARKRLRRQRAEIHAAMDEARVRVGVQLDVADVSPYSYKATDRKVDGNGWEIVRLDDTNDSTSVFGYAGSRDKARAWAREMNENPESAPVLVLTADQAMRSLGWLRTEDADERVRGSHGKVAQSVENKYVRVVA